MNYFRIISAIICCFALASTAIAVTCPTKVNEINYDLGGRADFRDGDGIKWLSQARVPDFAINQKPITPTKIMYDSPSKMAMCMYMGDARDPRDRSLVLFSNGPSLTRVNPQEWDLNSGLYYCRTTACAFIKAQ